MRSIVFAKRNFKEIVREPLNLFFCIIFPLCLLFLFKIIVSNMNEEDIINNVPQFQINRLAPSICVFGFSFLTLFSGMQISSDRGTSFLLRLKTSPMKAQDFIIGYILPMLPIAFVQIIIIYLCSIIIGLEVSWYLLISIIFLMIIALFFISIGLLLGTIFSDKAVGGISSLIINVAAILGGMFMPLENLSKGIQAFAYSLPFANALKVINAVLNNDYSDFIVPLIILLAYDIVISFFAVFMFNKKLSSDSL